MSGAKPQDFIRCERDRNLYTKLENVLSLIEGVPMERLVDSRDKHRLAQAGVELKKALHELSHNGHQNGR
ncbi:MAG: hypothetical protein A3D49_01760 [Candidatus Zambryskibacteria bacterium RIFCSPHIGHO2_02_FULL_43_37]|uniref:Uncharacterized protein n=1 Tax=Candidatus Zambryskibacteria bacterium RIFCSPHIGHO2_02_FULL_43_37 TaxID=1802749 RepID=A0A1G2TH12_9BACT|nr:MAG: hypothetical protein A2723_01140 [Candidatus Zambryskibacteria bacterium RIFCSPHIGHO2_01_FULL_52_18]OHA96580.1 MAG: hypothetical protein A3D49_01760 [Candidatus Zambryskibacteria bacterium RIFCSPHIGHO2_02_FULL_43_37]OHB07629.1 MAG: hypothetical protein A2944_00785 [Candidatus Zambryskibacteria bacterium RIFCSPLOWO2_01_FULL_52_12]